MRRTLLASLAGGLLLATGVYARPADIPLEAGAADAVVYVYRPARLLWSSRSATFEFDGMQYGRLINGGCTGMRVPGGEHAVGVSWGFDLLLLEDSQPPVEARVKLEPGERRYFRFTTSTLTDSMKDAAISWSMAEVSPETAESEMAGCLFTRPGKGKPRRLSAGAQGPRKPRR